MADIRIVPASQWCDQLKLHRDVDRIKVLITRAEKHMAQAQKNITEAQHILAERVYLSSHGTKV